MLDWFKDRYRAFQSSYDPDEDLAGSTPTLALMLVAVMVGTILFVGYGPVVARSAQLNRPWVPIALTVVAAATTYAAGRHRCRGPIGTAATLLDNMWWYFAIVYLAVNTAQPYAIGFSVAYALAVLLVTTRVYGLTLLFGLVLMLPVAILVPWFKPSASVALILWVTVILSLMTSSMTSKRHELLRRHQKLTAALTLSEEVADESMQAALATMLLSLGHFLHELRNHQTAIATNLSYLETSVQLSDDARDALADIVQSQAAEQNLVARTLNELRQRAKPELSTFALNALLAKVTTDIGANGRLRVSGGESEYLIVGNPAHLELILLNLVRNAIQAGAKSVYLDVRIQQTGEAVNLVVHDDGPGIAPSRRPTLFEPFAESSKIQGTGLGLYLCRRYVGLFGGTVSVGDGPFGGAAFTIQLPGQAVNRDSAIFDHRKSTNSVGTMDVANM
jgi:signal transduction histidine kinase